MIALIKTILTDPRFYTPIIILAALSFYHEFQLYFGRPTDENEKNRVANSLAQRRSLISQGTLAKLYKNLLKQTLDYVATNWTQDQKYLDAPNGWQKRVFGVQPFTERSYELSLRLALIYPIATFLIAWGLGGSGELAGASFLPSTIEITWRWIALAGTFTGAYFFYRCFRDQSKKKSIFFAVVGSIIILPAGFAAMQKNIPLTTLLPALNTGAVAIGAALGGHRTLAIGLIAIGGASLPYYSSLAISAYEITALLTTAVFLFVSILAWAHYSKSLTTPLATVIGWTLVSLTILVTTTVAIIAGVKLGVPSEQFAVPIFLSIFPLINAPLDWTSFGLTRGLLYTIICNRRYWVVSFLLAIADLVIGLLLLVATTAVAAITLASINRLTQAYSDAILLNLNSLLYNIEAKPYDSSHFWVYALLLSTLIPTCLHYLLASAAFMATPIPHWLRAKIVRDFDTSSDTRFCAFLTTSLVPICGALGMMALFYTFWFLISAYHGPIAKALLEMARRVAAPIDPTF